MCAKFLFPLTSIRRTRPHLRLIRERVVSGRTWIGHAWYSSRWGYRRGIYPNTPPSSQRLLASLFHVFKKSMLENLAYPVTSRGSSWATCCLENWNCRQHEIRIRWHTRQVFWRLNGKGQLMPYYLPWKSFKSFEHHWALEQYYTPKTGEYKELFGLTDCLWRSLCGYTLRKVDYYKPK